MDKLCGYMCDILRLQLSSDNLEKQQIIEKIESSFIPKKEEEEDFKSIITELKSKYLKK